MKKYVSLLLIPFLSSCCGCLEKVFEPCEGDLQYHQPFAPSPLETDIKVEEITYIIQNVTVKLRHRKRLHLQHAVSYFYDSVNSMRIEFLCHDILEQKQARELMVDTVEDLLAAINEDPELGPQLSNYPFTADNLEIYINFDSFYGFFVDPRYIGWLDLKQGIVNYYYFDYKDEEENCFHWKKEFYKTAREIVTYERAAERRYLEENPAEIKEGIFGKDRYIPLSF